MKCKEGFILVTNFGTINNVQRDVCMNEPSQLNCATYTIKDVTSIKRTDATVTVNMAQIECATCKLLSGRIVENNYPTEKDNDCFTFTPIPNCKVHQSGSKLSDTNLACLECNTDFFL